MIIYPSKRGKMVLRRSAPFAGILTMSFMFRLISPVNEHPAARPPFAGDICGMSGPHPGNGWTHRRGGYRDAACRPAEGPGAVGGDQATGHFRQLAREGADGSFKKAEGAPMDVVEAYRHDRRAARPTAYVALNGDRAVHILYIARLTEGLKRRRTFGPRLAEGQRSGSIRPGPGAFPGVRAIMGPRREGA